MYASHVAAWVVIVGIDNSGGGTVSTAKAICVHNYTVTPAQFKGDVLTADLQGSVDAAQSKNADVGC